MTAPGRWQLPLVVACVLLGGCERSSREGAQVELPPQLEATLAGAGLEARRSSPGSALRWQVPSCELEYQFRVSLTVEDEDEDGGEQLPMVGGMWAEGRWIVTPQRSRVRVRVEDLRAGYRHDEGRLPGLDPYPDERGSTESKLETDGRAWMESDDPSSVWSAFGTWPGLVTFHPSLPPSPDPGARTLWAQPRRERAELLVKHANKMVLGVPFEDGVAPRRRRALMTVELERWLELDGARAAMLHAELVPDGDRGPFGVLGSLRADTAGGLGARTSWSSEAHYLVLESGVLLAGVHEERTRSRWATSVSVQHQRAEARLVRGCGGPTLAEFEVERDQIETVFAEIASLRNDASAGRRRQVEAHLSPALRRAHPEAARCIFAALASQGEGALGSPELPNFNAPDFDREEVRVSLPTRFEGEGFDGMGSATYRISLTEAGPRIDSIELDRGEPDQVFLRLEPQAPAVGCPPTPSPRPRATPAFELEAIDVDGPAGATVHVELRDASEGSLLRSIDPNPGGVVRKPYGLRKVGGDNILVSWSCGTECTAAPVFSPDGRSLGDLGGHLLSPDGEWAIVIREGKELELRLVELASLTTHSVMEVHNWGYEICSADWAAGSVTVSTCDGRREFGLRVPSGASPG